MAFHEIKIVSTPDQNYLYLITCSGCAWQGRAITEEEAKNLGGFHISKHARENAIVRPGAD